MHRNLIHLQIHMGPRGPILLSVKPADSILPVVPLKSHWLWIYIGIRGIWVQTKGKHCKMLYKTIFLSLSVKRNPRTGKIQKCWDKTHSFPLPQHCLSGWAQHLAQHANIGEEKKSPLSFPP